MFRDNLKEQIEYKGLLTKELASKSGISKRTIDSYLANRAVIPNAEIAVKLAKALDTTVEYLVEGTETDRIIDVQKPDLEKYYKYKSVISEFDVLPEELQISIKAMIHTAANISNRI